MAGPLKKNFFRLPLGIKKQALPWLSKPIEPVCDNADTCDLYGMSGWMYSGDGMNESDDSSFWIPTILNVMDSDGCTAETGLIRYPPTAGVYIVQFEIISF